MSDRHKTPRTFASGSTKRNLRAEYEKRIEETLAKIPKLTNYFSKSSQEENSGNVKDSIEDFVKAVEDDSINTTEQNMELSESSKDNPRQVESRGFENDIGLWPELITEDMIRYWADKGSSTLQNCDETLFINSALQDQKKGDSNFVRKCSKSLFTRRNQNQETVNRFWLCFSPNTGKVYCYACKLMSPQKIKLSGEGFCDWKHASARLSEHEISKAHLESIMNLVKWKKVTGRIDQEIEKQLEEQSQYWRKVLRIIISTIKFIAERGLAFRGDNEIIGSPRNGNFLGILELLAEYEPFLANHIKEHANKGSHHVNYLSSTICEELINLMAGKVLDEIVNRIKKSKYYSVSVDSTPDEAHIDQLTVVIRYIENSLPKERFLTFLPNCGHTGDATARALLKFLADHDIDIHNCRGQSYDNAPNMSGKYKGMQALILEKNTLSVFVPCCGHSLNLVGKAAANSCASAVQFFDFLENLYSFFTASTERHKILTDNLSKGRKYFYSLKRLCDTRWSCRADATKAVVDSYNEIKETLHDISVNIEQKNIVRNEANSLLRKMNRLETAVYAIFWNDVLERFNATNKMLQDPKMVLESAVSALESLKLFVESKRNEFDKYEEAAQKLLSTNEYTETRTKTRSVRLNPLDYMQTPEVKLSPKEKFRVSCYIPVIDQLTISLTERLRAYDTVRTRFGFFNRLKEIDVENLQAAAEKLVEVYKDDLELSLGNELVQFVSLIDFYKNDDSQSNELFYYEILQKHNFKATFPNVEIALRIYLVLMVSSCSGERSFSKMKLIKNRLRTTMRQERLTHLSLLSIESDLLRELDFTDIINDFATKKARKVYFSK